jgi:hypothetical protein
MIRSSVILLLPLFIVHVFQLLHICVCFCSICMERLLSRSYNPFNVYNEFGFRCVVRVVVVGNLLTTTFNYTNFIDGM